MILFLLFLINGTFAFELPSPTPNAETHKKILKIFDERLSKIATKSEWSKYVGEHKSEWPDLKPDSPPSTIVVKEELKIDDEDFPIGTVHREVFVKTKISNVKSFMTSPQLFQFAYGLDAPSVTETPKNPNEFVGRIFKKVPGIEDQDYSLKYKIKEDKGLVIIRASLDDDRKGFALRDNLKVLEEVKGGVMIREISIVYPIRWYVRLFYGTTIDIMKKEMTKVSFAEKCVLENDLKKILDPETSKECWKKVEQN